MNMITRRLSLGAVLSTVVVGACTGQTTAPPLAPPEPVTLTFLAGPMPEEDLAELREAAPNLRIIAGLSRDEALRLAPEAHGIEGRFCTSELLAAAPNLRWVQATSAGVDRYLTVPELRDSDRIVLTNMQAVHGPTIADHAFAMLLALTRDLRFHLDPARRGTWDRGGSGAEPIALS